MRESTGPADVRITRVEAAIVAATAAAAGAAKKARQATAALPCVVQPRLPRDCRRRFDALRDLSAHYA